MGKEKNQIHNKWGVFFRLLSAGLIMGVLFGLYALFLYICDKHNLIQKGLITNILIMIGAAVVPTIGVVITCATAKHHNIVKTVLLTVLTTIIAFGGAYTMSWLSTILPEWSLNNVYLILTGPAMHFLASAPFLLLITCRNHNGTATWKQVESSFGVGIIFCVIVIGILIWLSLREVNYDFEKSTTTIAWMLALATTITSFMGATYMSNNAIGKNSVFGCISDGMAVSSLIFAAISVIVTAIIIIIGVIVMSTAKTETVKAINEAGEAAKRRPQRVRVPAATPTGTPQQNDTTHNVYDPKTNTSYKVNNDGSIDVSRGDGTSERVRGGYDASTGTSYKVHDDGSVSVDRPDGTSERLR